jgi:hypothetical protein
LLASLKYGDTSTETNLGSPTFPHRKSREEADNLPDPDVLAQGIVDDLEATLEQFREIATNLVANKLTEKDQ